MKKIFAKTKLFALILVSGAVFYSCSDDEGPNFDQANLVGAWTETDTEILLDGKSILDYYKDTPGVTDEQAQEAADLFEAFFGSEFADATVTFNEDGTYIIQGVDEGEWTLSGKKLTLDSSDPDSDNVEVELTKLDASSLTFTTTFSDEFVQGVEIRTNSSFQKNN